MPGPRWLTRLFHGDDPSTEEHRRPAVVDLIGYPGASLRQHKATGDLVADPGVVWRSGEHDGLERHILAEPTAPFTDVLLVLSHGDFVAATSASGAPWLTRLQTLFYDRYQALRAAEPSLPERRLRVRLVADGSGDVNRQSYGLPEGEFITGLAPHIYGGPSSRSRPLATVHLHLPDVSAGYRKVGRLFDDQRAFRLGSHWLDSFSDPELLEPALVELRPSADGGVEQRLRDDLPAEYSVQAEVQGGARVLTLRRNERAFAHLVVEIHAEQLQPQDLHKEARARLRLAVPPEEALARVERAAETHRTASRARHPNSTLTEVIVYADHARVTRVRQVERSPGRVAVRFRGLAPNMSAEGLSADLRAGRARVVDLRVVSDAQAEAEDRDQLRREALALVQSAQDLILQVEDLLRRRLNLQQQAITRPAEADEEGGAITLVRARLDRLRLSERELDEALSQRVQAAAALDDKLSAALRKLERPPADGVTVEVELDVRAPGPIELALHYTMQGARWSPTYTARYLESSNKLELTTHALVSQETGEDWSGVRVRLSTAADKRSADPPPLRPWALGSGPELAELLRANASASLTAISAEDEDTSDPNLHEANAPCTIPSGDDARVTLHVDLLSAEERLVCAPRIDARAFRRAVAPWTAPRQLPEGPVSSFLGNHYLGSGRLMATTPGHPVEVGLGPDLRVFCQRSLVERQRRENSPSPGLVSHLFHYRTMIASRRRERVTLRLIEQLPTPDDNGVQVMLSGASASVPTEALHNASDHTVSWDIVLEPGGMAAVEFTFTLIVPQGGETQRRLSEEELLSVI